MRETIVKDDPLRLFIDYSPWPCEIVYTEHKQISHAVPRGSSGTLVGAMHFDPEQEPGNGLMFEILRLELMAYRIPILSVRMIPYEDRAVRMESIRSYKTYRAWCSKTRTVFIGLMPDRDDR